MISFKVVSFALLNYFLSFRIQIQASSGSSKCYLPVDLIKEIHDHQAIVDLIINNATDERFYGSRYYTELQEFVDNFENRLSGSGNLENAIDYLIKQAKNRLLNVRAENVEVPRWTRGNESAYMISPTWKKLEIVGLGMSEGTPPEGITANVVVVSNFDELSKMGKKVKGKMVLFNVQYTTYGETAKYRNLGPSKASKLGAVAALIRSVTPFSINSPHTGNTKFENNDERIPAVAVTLEDADFMARAYAKNERIKIWLKMDAKLNGKAITRNMIAEMAGSSLPEEYVITSGHIDSWDNGVGALDDGVGAFLALHTLYLLNTMNIRPPRRSIRAILWSGEEFGLLGASQYRANHIMEIKKWTAVFESDAGSYNPLGLNIEGNHESWCIIKEIASMFDGLNATEVIKTKGVGSDVSVFREDGVPLLEPYFGRTNYFWYHHSAGDSMRTLDSKIMDKVLGLHAAAIYVLANLSIVLPRGTESVWNDYEVVLGPVN